MVHTEEQLILGNKSYRFFLKNLEKEAILIKQSMNALMSGSLKDTRSHQVLSNIMMHTIILINKYPYTKKNVSENN